MELTRDWVNSELRSIGLKPYVIPVTPTPSDILSLGTRHVLQKLVEKKIPEGKKIVDLASIVPRYEKLMFMTSSHYADHYEHCIKVALVGNWLLKQRFAFGKNREVLIKNIARLLHSSVQDTERIWWMTALLHDFAYPIITILKSAENLSREIEKSFVATGLKCYMPQVRFGVKAKQSADTLIKFAKTKMDKESANHLKARMDYILSLHAPSKVKTELNHGILGSLIPLSLCGDGKIFLEASLAIAVHDVKQMKISYSHLPLAFLLILCDEIQEFDRKRRKPRDLPDIGKPYFTPDYKEYTAVKRVLLNTNDSFVSVQTFFDQDIVAWGFEYENYIIGKMRNLTRLHRGVDLENTFPRTIFSFCLNEKLPKSIEIAP